MITIAVRFTFTFSTFGLSTTKGTSSGTAAPGRAEMARRIAFGMFAEAPSVAGETWIFRVGLITSGSARSNVFRTSFVAWAGVSQPKRTLPTVTPGAMSARFGDGDGCVGVVAVVSVVAVVLVSRRA